MTYPANTAIITLYTPIQDDRGSELTTLTMREPRVLDRIRHSYLKGTTEENDVAMIAGLCDIHPDVIKNLTAADYQQLEDQFLVFMAPPAERDALRKRLKVARKRALTTLSASGTFSGE